MTDFVFKDVINYSNYKISECGKMLIKKQYTDLKGNIRKEKLISQFLDSNGRVKVMLSDKGEKSGKSVLTEIIVRSIKTDLSVGIYTNIEVAKRNNTSVHNVSDIKNKRTWSHLN